MFLTSVNCKIIKPSNESKSLVYQFYLFIKDFNVYKHKKYKYTYKT